MSSTLSSHRRSAPRGVTLIELLVVLTIMLMVTAAAIPIMAPAMQNRRMREASRLVSSYISGARSRAIENGRPVGVMIERFNNQSFAFSLSYAEVPPPYAGDNTGSVVTINSSGTGVTFSPTLVSTDMFREGDAIKLNNSDTTYYLSNSTNLSAVGNSMATNTTQWKVLNSDGTAANVPPAFATTGVPYQIIRLPVRSASPPLQLPEGIVIDLFGSGEGITGMNVGTWNPIIMFSPNGTVSRTNWQNGRLNRPSGSSFLLLGRRELMSDASKSGQDENLWSGNASLLTTPNDFQSSLWVSVGFQTGQVAVAENNVNDGSSSMTTGIGKVRAFVQTGQGVGGR